MNISVCYFKICIILHGCIILIQIITIFEAIYDHFLGISPGLIILRGLISVTSLSGVEF